MPAWAREAAALVTFFAFSHGWTFALWAIAAALPGTVWEPPGRAWFLMGGAGVLLAGLITVVRFDGRPGLADLARRTFDARRAGPAPWAVALLFAPFSTLAAAGLVRAVAPDAAALAPALPAGSAVDVLAVAALLLVLGPLPEEIGWRGVLLDRLLRRTGPLAATAVVALAWWSWHLPLHLIPGYYAPFAHPPGLGSQLVGIAAAAVLSAWLYLRSARSVLVVVVFHWSVNLTGEWLRPAPPVDAVQLALALVAAAVVAGLGLPRRARAP